MKMLFLRLFGMLIVYLGCLKFNNTTSYPKSHIAI